MLTKAQLYNLDSGQMVVECHFNPEELSITRNNQWQPHPSAGSNLPDVHFEGMGPRSIDGLRLVFDTYERHTDVRDVTNKVVSLMNATAWEASKTGRQRRPPHVMFRWGAFETFPAVVTNLNQKFTLFLNSGLPVRATLTLSLQEVPKQATKKQTKGQNPTSHSTGANRIRVVQPGDTIDLLAALELGEAAAWRRLADANNLDDPRRLRPGRVLLIPAEI
jgi:hypothetical protein